MGGGGVERTPSTSASGFSDHRNLIYNEYSNVTVDCVRYRFSVID